MGSKAYHVEAASSVFRARKMYLLHVTFLGLHIFSIVVRCAQFYRALVLFRFFCQCYGFSSKCCG